MLLHGFQSVLAACLLINVLPAQASEQELYFHLHQAYELLELQKKGRCSGVLGDVRRHLEEADKEIGKVSSKRAKTGQPVMFEQEARKLGMLLRAPEQATLVQVEKIRSEIQAIADSLKLEHRKEWHEEINACREVFRATTGSGD